MRRVVLLAVLTAVIVLAGAVTSAQAYHQDNTYFYYSGSLTTGEFRTYPRQGCLFHNWLSDYYWTTGAGAYGTAAILDGNGGWIASDRTNTGHVYAAISPNDGAGWKALCKNSTPWQVTIGADCYDKQAIPDSPCI